jgi:hypothetical protein
MTPQPTTELEAAQAFAADLCRFQVQAGDHGTTVGLLASAHEHGFSWFSRPSPDDFGTQVVLCHVGGETFSAIGNDPAQLLLGLLGELKGIPLLASQPDPEPEPAQPEPPASQVAAESLAAATGGAVFELAEGDPDLTLLTDGMKAQAVQMVSELTAQQRKSFAIAFRNAFNVGKEERSVIPLITQIRHAKFINDFTIEANGGVAA